MSFPNFPPDMVKIEWDQALSMVVASIAMEELALSHILNAEGEKLQYVLGMLHKDQACCASTCDILRVNESIGSILDKVAANQILLKGKLEQAIKANQKHTKKPSLYHGVSGFCWFKGNPLPWLSEHDMPLKDSSCYPYKKIILPSGSTSLISYTFCLELTSGEPSVAILLQKLYGANREALAVEQAHVCYGENVVHLCGCVVVPPKECGDACSEIEFVLSAPCFVSVKQAALIVAAI